jgi:ABC-2 type transport system permease protein
MTTSGTVLLVARREVTTRLVTRGNLWSMAVMVVVVVAAIVVAAILIDRNRDAEPRALAVTSSTEALARGFADAAEAAGEPLDVRVVASDDAARTALADQDVVAALVGSPAEPELLTGDDTPGSWEGAAGAATARAVVDQEIVDLGGDPVAVQEQVAASALTVTRTGEDRGFDVASYVVSLAVMALMFYLIISTGTQIASGVVEEKASRIVELLLATIRPWQLLAGKVLGIGLVGLIQVAVIVTAALVAGSTSGLLGGIDVPITGVLGWSAVWLLLGFLLFAVLWGGAAALVSRQEEIGQVTGPLMMLLFVPFYATMFLVVNDPSGVVARAMTLFPFSAPFAAPVRFAYGAIGTAEMLTAVAITLLAVVACTLLSGRLYHSGVLHTGSRMRFRDALRPARPVARTPLAVPPG